MRHTEPSGSRQAGQASSRSAALTVRTISRQSGTAGGRRRSFPSSGSGHAPPRDERLARKEAARAAGSRSPTRRVPARRAGVRSSGRHPPGGLRSHRHRSVEPGTRALRPDDAGPVPAVGRPCRSHVVRDRPGACRTDFAADTGSRSGRGRRIAAQRRGTLAATAGSADITVSVKDDRSTPDGAREAAAQAVAEGDELILGPLFASSVREVSGPARSANRPVIAFSTDTSTASRGVYLLSFSIEGYVDRSSATPPRAARNRSPRWCRRTNTATWRSPNSSRKPRDSG